jgi:hypothetical protein
MMREMCLPMEVAFTANLGKEGTLPLPLSQGKPENPKMCIIVRLQPGEDVKNVT